MQWSAIVEVLSCSCTGGTQPTQGLKQNIKPTDYMEKCLKNKEQTSRCQVPVDVSFDVFKLTTTWKA